MMGMGEPARKSGGGFAARSGGGRAEAAISGLGGLGKGRRDRVGGMAFRASSNRDEPASGAGDDGRRLRSLAAISAASAAVAFIAIGYGVWSAASSAAAVEEATSGAERVLVASGDIKAGDVLTSASFEERSIPEQYRCGGAVSASLAASPVSEGGVVGGRALVDIPSGSQVASSFVSGVGDGGHLASQLGSGKEAVTIGVDAETGVAGHVKPFDAVRVVSAEGASSGASVVETVCARAKVLSVGSAGSSASSDGSAYSSVTVEATPEEAEAIREAQYAGRVSLLLLPAVDTASKGE